MTTLSRNGTSCPIGKLTEQIPAIRVSGETKDILTAEARQAGLNLQEFVRELLMIRAHGLDMVRRMHEERLERVSGKFEDGQQ